MIILDNVHIEHGHILIVFPGVPVFLKDVLYILPSAKRASAPCHRDDATSPPQHLSHHTPLPVLQPFFWSPTLETVRTWHRKLMKIMYVLQF